MGWLKRFMRDDSGFTVVEYLVAAAILFIVSTGVMGALAYASTANASTAMRQLGLEVANQRMEQARNLPYDSLGTTNGYPIGTIVTPEHRHGRHARGHEDVHRRDRSGLVCGLGIEPVL